MSPQSTHHTFCLYLRSYPCSPCPNPGSVFSLGRAPPCGVLAGTPISHLELRSLLSPSPCLVLTQSMFHTHTKFKFLTVAVRLQLESSIWVPKHGHAWSGLAASMSEPLSQPLLPPSALPRTSASDPYSGNFFLTMSTPPPTPPQRFLCLPSPSCLLPSMSVLPSNPSFLEDRAQV